MGIYDYLYDLTSEDYAELIKRRLPDEVKYKEIKVVHRSVEYDSYIDVSFYIDGVQTPPEVFYTHFYFPELEKYWGEEKVDVCEWVSVNSLWQEFYKTGCGKDASWGLKDHLYCPYCDKKIKIMKKR